MYKFELSNRSSISSGLVNEHKLVDIHPISLDGGDLSVCLRQGNTLYGYFYLSDGSNWSKVWNQTVFPNHNYYPLDKYPWLVTDKLLNKDIIIIKHPDGVRLYELNSSDKPGLSLVKEDGHFHDVYGNMDLLWGNFYPDINEIGVLARSIEGVRFFIILNQSLSPGKNWPLYPLASNISLTPNWNSPDTDLFLTKLKHNDPVAIGLRTNEGLEFYEFNTNYLLNEVIKTACITRPPSSSSSSLRDRLFFADLTHQIYQDILYLNDSGLFVYQYDDKAPQKDYKLLHHDTRFMLSSGWLSKYSNSIRLIDLNSDGFDDLVFTGVEGLTGMTFDTSRNSWRTLSTSYELSAPQRFGTMIGGLPAVPPKLAKPSIFIQDTGGQINWIELVEDANISAATKAEATTNTTPTTLITTTESPSHFSRGAAHHSMIPSQIQRKSPSEKPILRWSEQWPANFFKDAVDAASGQVKLSIPLLDLSYLTGWNVQLSLSYDSELKTSDFLGLGWSIPVAQDYIAVDHKGSVFANDASYYLVIKGRPLLLKPIGKRHDNIRHFEVSNLESNDELKVNISYNESDQRWIVEGNTEKIIYGRAKESSSATDEALLYSLAWPNWRGVCRTLDQLEPLIRAWYLISRYDKRTKTSLDYYYDKYDTFINNGKSYTSAFYLKSISDSEEMRLVLNYERKLEGEYSKSELIDNEGNIIFPKPLENSHYLSHLTIFTANYQQVLKFKYKIVDNKRLLTDVEQELHQETESLLSFSYANLLNHSVLDSCNLLNNLSTIHLSYQAITLPEFTDIKRFPIRESPKIVYGPDFTVMGYRNLNHNDGKVFLRVMNSELTKTIADCSIDDKLVCPSTGSEIKDYNIQPYEDSFVVSVITDQKQFLYVYNRKDNEHSWSLDESLINNHFDKNTLVQYNDRIIVLVESNKNSLKILERLDHQSKWIEVLNEAKFYKISRLALHNKLVVVYDINTLWIYYQDDDSVWKSKILAFSIMSRNLNPKSIDFDAAKQQDLSESLDRYGLQVVDNFILLYSLEENDGQLTSRAQLFLLDSRYGIAQTDTFYLQEENLRNLNYEIENDGSIYTVSYEKENEIFKAKIISASGKVAKAVEETENKSARSQRRKKLIENINESEDFKKLLATNLIIHYELYGAFITPQGAYIGNHTILRITGTGWQKESLDDVLKTPLGKYFSLESANNEKSLIKLKRKHQEMDADGEVEERVIKLDKSGQIINRFPAYIAYHLKPDLIEVLTFKDEKTFGQIHLISGEQLVFQGSSFKNLITISNVSATIAHTETMECIVRPAFTLLSPKAELFVSQTRQVSNHVDRITAYERSFYHSPKLSTLTSKVKIIPENDKSTYGWNELTITYCKGNITTTQDSYNSDGSLVLKTPDRSSESKNEESSSREEAPHHELNPMLLLDRSGNLIISDFSPYSLADEMVAYYGFESYEENRIGGAESGQSWKMNQAEVIKDSFALTGQHYLQLNNRNNNNTPYFEGLFNPRDQENTYLASCWIRSKRAADLPTGSPTSYLKAVIFANNKDEKLIGLQAQIKYQSGDWSYLELALDFKMLKQIYQNYYSHYDNKMRQDNRTLSSPDNVKFKIKLRVEVSNDNEIVHLDHIRFSLLTHDFKANVFNYLRGETTAIIQANGLIARKIYDRFNREVARLDEHGDVKHFISSSQTGRLVPMPRGTISDNVKFSPVLNLIPAKGSYETFDEHSLRNRWQVDNPANWNIAPAQLWHKNSEENSIQASGSLFDQSSAVIRFYFALQDQEASLSLHWKGIGHLKLTQESNNSANMLLPDNRSISPLPLTGELIVMVDDNYLWVWMDTVLLVDQELFSPRDYTGQLLSPWLNFKLLAQGEVLIEDCLVMNRPQVTVEYHNSFGEKVQVIRLKDSQTIEIVETLHDPLGREAINTKPTRIKRNPGEALLIYRPNFVDNKNPSNAQSVWQTGEIRGEVDVLNPQDLAFAYSRTKYAPNPLNQERVFGLPGPEFSVDGKYAVKKSDYSDISFLDNLFPRREGYYQRVEYLPNGSCKVYIYDKRKNRVAIYTRVFNYNHLLSTYEYDGNDRLVKVLPPLYHEKVNTSYKSNPWQPGERHLSDDEKKWQAALATYFNYDQFGHLIRKTTPDTGITEYIYDSSGQKRFMVSRSKIQTNRIESVVYFDYDSSGQLISSGQLTEPLPDFIYLHKYLQNETLPLSQEEYQQFNYADDKLDPSLRGRLKYYVTNNDGEVIVTEKVHFNTEEQIATKDTVMAFDGLENDVINSIRTQYVNRNLHSITYPVNLNGRPVELIHEYNRFGQLTGLSMFNESIFKAAFSYHAHSKLASESYRFGGRERLLNQDFTRNYYYNSPGFLEKISDPFLTENIDSVANGYGQDGFGDGMITRTSFNASWPSNSDGRWFEVDEDGIFDENLARCIRALKNNGGYLGANGHPIKAYNPDIETKLPLTCQGETSRRMAKLIAQKQVPQYYGHSYSYGNHQELVKAKYFTSDTINSIRPLQQNSFSKHIPDLTLEQSQNIWNLLINADYIITDQQRNDPSSAIGKSGKSFLRSADLLGDLKNLNEFYIKYQGSIEKFIISAISDNSVVSLSDFEKVFLDWEGVDIKSSRLVREKKLETGNQIGQMLIDKNYLPVDKEQLLVALNANFTATLHEYINFIPKIVKTLSNHFSHELGKTPFDMDSYEIDANGNHRLFYSGFNRYELSYANSTNQIEFIKQTAEPLIDENGKVENFKTYAMKHDQRGNVVQALHKNIQHIKYHPVSQRATSFQLTDGRKIKFYYDAAGERILKEVRDSENRLANQRRYSRDERGRVLVDQYLEYNSEGSTIQDITTAYLYGPRGLLGFVRNNNFYGVTTDHAGSIRLVFKDNRVVSAYDYLAYGEIMRSFGSASVEVNIVYRYTGQEWDEETGLYNYHARLYDPSIGRFYQPDPKSQYFSPYKYAGNSPISLTDPDGEFAWLIFAIIGAYLGGSAANEDFNPINWDYKDKGTWFGIVGGGLIGGLLPGGFAASVRAISARVAALGITASVATGIGVGVTTGLGAGGAYLSLAAAHKDWSLSNVEWESPGTYNTLFGGFVTGSGLIGGIQGVRDIAGKIGKNSLIRGRLFLGFSFVTSAGLAVYKVYEANGRKFSPEMFKNPEAWLGITDGVFIGTAWPVGIVKIGSGIKSAFKNFRISGLRLPDKNIFKVQEFLKILKNPKHPLFAVACSIAMAYWFGSAANSKFDNWHAHEFSTYESVLNGIFLGKDLALMRNLAAGSKPQKVSSLKSIEPKIKQVKLASIHWSKKVNDIFESIKTYRFEQNYYHLMKIAFAESRSVVSKLSNNKSPLPKKQVENFFKKGWKEFREGTNKIPTELHRIIADLASQKTKSDLNELIEWSRIGQEEMRKRQQVFLDEEEPFLNCKSAKRRKRSALIGCFFKDAVDQLKEDPVLFMRNNAISTEMLGKGKVKLRNGDVHEFKLEESSVDKAYYIQVAEPNYKGKTFKAYFLATNDRIDINPHHHLAEFVITGRMEGCSMYVKEFDGTGLELYHYNARGLEQIYLNEHSDSRTPIFEGKPKYLDVSGKPITELSDAEMIVDREGNEIPAQDGVITIDQPLFKRLQDGSSLEIEKINDDSINDMIRRNRDKRLEVERLDGEYDFVLKSEEYLRLPRNDVFMQQFGLSEQKGSTMILYFDNHKYKQSGSYIWSFGGWNIISQRVIHKGRSRLRSASSKDVKSIIDDFGLLDDQPSHVVLQVRGELNLRRRLGWTIKQERLDHMTNRERSLAHRILLELFPEDNLPGGRRRRSINATQEYMNNPFIMQPLRAGLTDKISFNILIDANGQREISKNESDHSRAKYTESEHFGYVTSSAARSEFWPIILFLKTSETFSSILSVYWSSNSKDDQLSELFKQEPSREEPKQSSARVLSIAHQSASPNTESSGPDIAEVFDWLISSSNINSLLCLADLVARKWTGYRPKVVERPPGNSHAVDRNGINVLSAIRSPKFLESSIDGENKDGDQSRVCSGTFETNVLPPSGRVCDKTVLWDTTGANFPLSRRPTLPTENNSV